MLTYATFTENNITIFTFLTAKNFIYHYFHFYYIKIIFYPPFAALTSDVTFAIEFPVLTEVFITISTGGVFSLLPI